MASTGRSRPIIKGKKWEISAVYDAIFQARDIDITGGVLFSSCFPNLEDFKLIVASGIDTVYFCGKIDKPDAVELLNTLPDAKISLEIIQIS
jgi:hypothetical protein